MPHLLSPESQVSVPWLLIALGLICLWFYLTPLNWYRTARDLGLSIRRRDLFQLWLRRVSPADVVLALHMAEFHGLSVDLEKLALHCRRGGDNRKVVTAMGCAKREDIELSFEVATRIDLSGQDVSQVVEGWIKEKEEEREKEYLAQIPSM
jgi:uncharacterized protein YqfA (UPF0365 family)